MAGKREGLAGERSGLFMEQMRIIKEMREESERRGLEGKEIKPRYMVWENVCFTQDTLITCDTGYKKISEVKVGDNVKTHLGRFMPVVKTYKHENKEVIRLKTSGSEDVIVTPNHPIWVREKKYVKGVRTISNPYWCPAGELTKHHLVAYVLDVPSKESDITKAEAWALGRWLADGSVDLKKSNPRIFISCGLKKAEETYNHLSELPYIIHENHPHETAINFVFTSADFYNRVIKDCGKGAGNKVVPAWVFSLPIEIQKSVLDGYISGDGYIRTRGNGIELAASTASRNLVYGISRLLRNVYHNAVSVSVSKSKNGMIGDRVIKANYPCYQIYMSLTNKNTLSYFDGNAVWQPVKEVSKETEKYTVYNLSVLEDNTYEANQFVGHNCGAFSSGKPKGADFQAVLQEICKVVCKNCPSIPIPKEGWHYAGNLDGVGDDNTPFSISWRLHDAQYWGVPQRRRRVCVVADFGGNTASKLLFELWGKTEQNNPDIPITDIGNESEPEVQFERQSLPGNTEKSRNKGEGITGTSKNNLGKAISFQERGVNQVAEKEY